MNFPMTKIVLTVAKRLNYTRADEEGNLSHPVMDIRRSTVSSPFK
jgi:hypothetical protein